MSGFSVAQQHSNVHEGLVGVLGLAQPVGEIPSAIVHLIEDTGEVDWEVRRAVTRVGSSAAIRDVRFVVGRIDVLSVPAALEVLGDNK